MMKTRQVYSIVQSRWFLPSIAVIALFLRLSLIFVTHHFKTPVFADEIDYMNIGLSLEQGKGFIKDGIHYTAYRPPAQPLVIALLFSAMGLNLLAIKIFEAVLLLTIPFVCSKVGRLLGLSVVASNVGAVIATFHPVLAYASSTLYPTVLTTVALTLGVWLCAIAMSKNRLCAGIGAGLSFGVAGSATTTFAPLAVVAGLILLFKGFYRLAFTVGLLGTLPILLWMIRNDHMVGKFTVATNGGYNIYLGANDLATPMSGNWVDPHIYDENEIGELAVDEGYKNLATAWIKKHPVRWAELAVARSIVVFDSVGNPRTQGIHSGLAAHLMGWAMLPVVLLGLLGLFANYRNPLSWLTLASLFLVVISSAATIAKPRFRLPCDPLLAEFSIAGALFLKKRMIGSGVTTQSENLIVEQFSDEQPI